MIYYAGHNDGSILLYPYLDASKRIEAYAAVAAATPPVGWMMGGIFGFIAFLVLFAAMPTILGISEKDAEKGNGKDEEHPPS